jgi:hypothetical protein
MGLLAPWFLAGAALIGIPLYVHLLQRATSIELPFASTMFFEKSFEATSKQRRLRYLLLLALRIAILALLALAFAKPYFNSAKPPGDLSNRLIIIALDQTASMGAENGFQKAKAEAVRFAQSVPKSSSLKVISLDAKAELAHGREANREDVLAALNGLQLGSGSTSLTEAIRLALALGAAEKRPAELHLFSDFQRSAIADAASVAANSQLGIIPHATRTGSPRNLFVESVQVSPVVYSGDAIKVSAVIGQTSAPTLATAGSEWNVSLWRGKEMLEQKKVVFDAASKAVQEKSTVDFFKFAPAYGANLGEIRVTTQAGEDALASDNRMQFVVQRAEAQKLLYLHDGADSRSPIFFRAALPSATGQAFQPEIVRSGGFGTADLKRFGMIILSDAGVTAEQAAALKKYVENGGGLLILAGPTLGAKPSLPVLDFPIKGTLYAARETARFFVPTRLDFSHPTLQKLDSIAQVKFFQAADVTAGAGTNVLAYLDSQSPLLFENRIGQGRVITFTSSWDGISNELPLSALMVPMLSRLVPYLANAAAVSTNSTVGGLLDLRLPTDPAGTVDVTDPEGRHPLSVAEAAKLNAFQPLTEGLFAIRRTTGRTNYVAVNTDRRESDLETLTPEDLELWCRPTGSAASNESAADNGAKTPTTEQRQPLWWILLFLLVGVALFEAWLAGRYLSVDRRAA